MMKGRWLVLPPSLLAAADGFQFLTWCGSCQPVGLIIPDGRYPHARDATCAFGLPHPLAMTPVDASGTFRGVSVRWYATVGGSGNAVGDDVSDSDGVPYLRREMDLDLQTGAADLDDVKRPEKTSSNPPLNQKGIDDENDFEEPDTLLGETYGVSSPETHINTKPFGNNDFEELDDFFSDSQVNPRIEGTTTNTPSEGQNIAVPLEGADLFRPSDASSDADALNAPQKAEGKDWADSEPMEPAAGGPTSRGPRPKDYDTLDPWLNELLTIEDELASPRAPADRGDGSGGESRLTAERSSPALEALEHSPSWSAEANRPLSPSASSSSTQEDPDMASVDGWLDELLEEEGMATYPTMETDGPRTMENTASGRGGSWGAQDGRDADGAEWGANASASGRRERSRTDRVARDGRGGDRIEGFQRGGESPIEVSTGDMMQRMERWRNERAQQGGGGGGQGVPGGVSWRADPERGTGRGHRGGPARGQVRGRGRSERRGYGGIPDGPARRGRKWADFDQEGGRVLDPTEAAQEAVLRDLESLRRQGRWEDALRALVSARIRGLTVNILMYNGAMRAVAEWGRWKEALSMVEQMRKDGLEPNIESYTAGIIACGKAGKILEAFDLLKEMESHGIRPDRECYGAMITACADVGYPEKARSMMRRMRDDGHVPDRDTYNWAIVACGENGDWETALELLDEMRREGLRPDLYSYQMAMKACGSGGKWERAVQLLSEMEEDGTAPETPAYKAALETLKDAGQWESAVSLLDEMDEMGVEPDGECFNLAISTCAEIGLWEKAFDVFRNMRSSDIVPELPTYNALLKGCMKGRAWERSLSLLKEMKTSGRNPNQESWDLAFIACADAGRWECCLGVVEMMLSQNVWFDLNLAKDRFDDCPNDDLRRRAFETIHGYEAIEGPTMKRKSRLSKTRYEKLQAKRSKPAIEKDPPKQKKRPTKQPSRSSKARKETDSVSFVEVDADVA